MLKLAITITLLCISILPAAERGATNRPERAPAPATATPAAGTGRTPVPVPLPPAPLPFDGGWTPVDSVSFHLLLPAGERAAVIFDHASGRLRDTLASSRLTPAGQTAVAIAPTWLRDDLADNLRRLGPAMADRLAALIVDCPDKRYYDELCFQAAHLPGSAFNGLDLRLLVDNVQFAYAIDRELQYVDIVDYGDGQQGGDYYSTTRYRTLVAGETTWVEVPREIYYWWVVMPKVSDEPPAYVYGMFWREYLFYHCDSGYPLLRENLVNTRLFWDGETHSWGGPPTDTLPAVAVVGRWTAATMPEGASGNRPIQPNQIAHEHNGNCGEMQDLLCAAARTALIPTGCVLNINEDHVWNEVWWDGAMQPYANDPTTHIKTGYVAYDRKYGGGKNCSGIWDWRNDGLQTSVTASYSDVCTLHVEVRDSTLRPVDGALVKITSEDWYGGTTPCFYGTTDRHGRYSTVLGDWQNYYLAIDGPGGQRNLGRIIDSADAAPDASFFVACTLAGRIESLSVRPDSAPGGDWRLDVSFSAGHETRYGTDCYNSNGANQYAVTSVPGAADLFVCSRAEFGRYLAGSEFGAAAASENAPAANHSLELDGLEDWVVVISNEEQQNLTLFVDATVRLLRRGTAIAGEPTGPAGRLRPGPNPCRGRLLLTGAPAAGRGVQIVDAGGRLVATLRPGGSGIAWDGSADDGLPVRPGVYFVRAGGAMSRFVWLGR